MHIRKSYLNRASFVVDQELQSQIVNHEGCTEEVDSSVLFG